MDGTERLDRVINPVGYIVPDAWQIPGFPAFSGSGTGNPDLLNYGM